MTDHEPELSDTGLVSDGAKVERVQAQLREMILKGELRAGHPIRERALSDQLGVSRTPMREALKLLAGENLVELHPRRGATVALLSRREVYEIVQVLAALEACAAEIFCDVARQEDIDELWALHYEMLAFRARGDRLNYFENNQKIHLGIVGATRNAVLIDHHRLLNARVYRLRFVAHQNATHWAVAAAEHDDIIKLLEARDRTAAAATLKAHVSSIWTRLSELLAEDGSLIS